MAPRCPRPSYRGYISGFEGFQGHELHVFQLPMVQLIHPTQEVQVQRQVGQLLGHREPQHVTPPSPRVAPRCDRGWRRAGLPRQSVRASHRRSPLGTSLPLQGERVGRWHGEEELTFLRTSRTARYRAVTFCPAWTFVSIFAMLFSSWRTTWGRDGGGDTHGVTLHAKPGTHPGGAGVGLKPPAGAATPGRGPEYLPLRLVPLVTRLGILQLLQPPLQLVHGLAPLPQLVQQHVAGIHLVIDFGPELLLGHLDGHASVRQAGGRAHWAPAGEGGPAWKTPPKVEPGTLGRCSGTSSLPWQDGVWESFALGDWLG